MDNLEQRLENLFSTVFPDLPSQKIRQASQNSIETWDSVAAITLLNLIEEEFGIQMDFEDIGDLTSFSSIAEYLKGKLSHTAA
jgi:acyl carrier protein